MPGATARSQMMRSGIEFDQPDHPEHSAQHPRHRQQHRQVAARDGDARCLVGRVVAHRARDSRPRRSVASVSGVPEHPGHLATNRPPRIRTDQHWPDLRLATRPLKKSHVVHSAAYRKFASPIAECSSVRLTGLTSDEGARRDSLTAGRHTPMIDSTFPEGSRNHAMSGPWSFRDPRNTPRSS